MAKDTVWIIVPVYNAEKTLKKCVESVRKQTYPDWKLVLVDDGSPDNSGAMCDELAGKDNRIIAVHQSNAGPGAARRKGLSMVPDDGFCAFCDSDDWLPSTALEALHAQAVETGADIVCGQWQRFYKGVKFPSATVPDCFASPKCYSHDEFMSGLYISCFGISDFPMSLCAKLYKTDKLKRIALSDCRTPEKFAEDLDVILRLIPVADKVSVIQDTVYSYRIGGGTTRFMPEILSDSVFMYNRKKEYIKYYTGNLDAFRLIAIELKNIAMSYLVMCNRFGRFPLGGNLKSEAQAVCNMPEIKDAVALIEGDTSGYIGSAEAFLSGDPEKIAAVVNAQQDGEKGLKALAKKLLSKL